MSSFCTIFYYKYVSACLMETAIMSVETCKGEMSHFDVRQREGGFHVKFGERPPARPLSSEVEAFV